MAPCRWGRRCWLCGTLWLRQEKQALLLRQENQGLFDRPCAPSVWPPPACWVLGAFSLWNSAVGHPLRLTLSHYRPYELLAGQSFAEFKHQHVGWQPQQRVCSAEGTPCLSRVSLRCRRCLSLSRVSAQPKRASLAASDSGVETFFSSCSTWKLVLNIQLTPLRSKVIDPLLGKVVSSDAWLWKVQLLQARDPCFLVPLVHHVFQDRTTAPIIEHMSNVPEFNHVAQELCLKVSKLGRLVMCCPGKKASESNKTNTGVLSVHTSCVPQRQHQNFPLKHNLPCSTKV